MDIVGKGEFLFLSGSGEHPNRKPLPRLRGSGLSILRRRQWTVHCAPPMTHLAWTMSSAGFRTSRVGVRVFEIVFTAP
ncbi:hypothetical protein CEXT_695111 [Caerostris extrusa]|uniref:Uncharacterized protein n=1 Tax=Caerostris extrusa TaxID=172846 RepID=A0AAV4X4K0_CAEEX|nr:hypothetical protein CEXT_695111 [Caerostris extrusa]